MARPLAGPALALAALLPLAACTMGSPGPITGAATAGPAAPAAVAAPESLVGLDAGRLGDMLGPPDWQRREGKARVLQFAAADCILDVYLYPEGNGPHRVTFVEARSRAGGHAAPPGCLKDIATRPQGPV